MQTTLNPKKRKRGGSQSQLSTWNRFRLRKQKTCWVIKEDYAKDLLKLPQLWIWFKAAETEICFTQAVAVWEFRLTKLGSFTCFLMADSSSSQTSLDSSVSPIQHMIIQAQRHLASENTWLNTKFAIHRLALSSSAPTPPAFFVIQKLLLDPSYCLQLSFSDTFCRISCRTSPQHGWLWTEFSISL